MPDSYRVVAEADNDGIRIVQAAYTFNGTTKIGELMSYGDVTLSPEYAEELMNPGMGERLVDKKIGRLGANVCHFLSLIGTNCCLNMIL